MWLAYLQPFLHGAGITLAVSICALIFGLFLAFIFAWGEGARFKLVQKIFLTITIILRGLPELVVLFMIYFGSTILITKLMGHYVNVNAFISGVLALGLIFAAYAAQTLRGAYFAIPKGQLESGLVLGFTRWQVFKKIMLPQLWKQALPGLSNLWLVLLKDSALVSLIGLSDVLNTAHVAASVTNLPFNFYVAAGAVYLLFTSVSELGIRRLKHGMA